MPAAELVEVKARHVPGLPTPGLAVYPVTIDAPGRALPRGLRVVDAGMAVVTNHRVAFSGRQRPREWTYEDMMGPAHHPDVPLTLLHTTDGGHLAGLLVPAPATVNFRFYLTLAFAVAIGKRTAVAAHSEQLRHPGSAGRRYRRAGGNSGHRRGGRRTSVEGQDEHRYWLGHCAGPGPVRWSTP